MANKPITLKRNNSGTIDNLYPTTEWNQIESKPSTFTPTSHEHDIDEINGLIESNSFSGTYSPIFYIGNDNRLFTKSGGITFTGSTNTLAVAGNVTVGGNSVATLASPALTGTPTAPTAAANTNSTQIATTAYVQQEITDLIGGAPGALDTLNELAAAINDDSSFASTVTTNLAGKLNLTGGTLTGTLTTRAINASNYNITGVGALQFNDPGPNEGISWSGGNFSIYESPNDLSTNSSGNLQFVSGGSRRLTVQTDGTVYAPGAIQSGDSVVTPEVQMTSNPARNKIRVWSGGTYGIGMTSGFTYGGLGTTGGEYAMTFQMNDDNDRGFWWGDSVHTGAQGAMALTTAGKLTVADKIRVGYGQSDTTDPADFALDANGDIKISNSNPVLRLNDTGTTTGDAYIDYQAGTSLKVHAGADPITFIAGNSEKARLTAGNGYLGVGTTNPSYGIDVHANNGQIRAYGTTAKLWAEASDTGQASLELKNTEGHLRFITDNGAFQLYDQTDSASRFEIDTNGNSKVFGNLTVQSTFPRIYLTDTDNDSDFSIINNNGTLGVYDDTNGAYRMQIESSGNTTFSKRVTIDTGASSDDALVIRGTSPTITFSDDSTGTDSNDDFYIHINGNNFYILADRDGNGNVGTGYETPHPLQLEADTNIGYLFGERIATRDYVDTEIAGVSGGSGYTHPTHPGDDINIDTGALTGATVISDLDFNVTSDTEGHITDANATVSTRELTASDIGAAAASHTHGSYDNSGTLTGANVYSQVAVTDGIVTGLTSRTLTAANIGAAASSHNHDGGDITTGTVSSNRLPSGTVIGGPGYSPSAGDTLYYTNGAGWATTERFDWIELKSGTSSVSGTTVTNVTLSSAIDDTSVIAFELNTSSATSITSQVHIVKIENSSSVYGGVLYNAYAASTLIRPGSIRVYRGADSTTLSFSYAYYFTNGSSSESSDFVYIGKIWKLQGITGV